MENVIGDMSIKRINMLSFTFYVYFLLTAYIGSVLILVFDEVPYNRIISQLSNSHTRLYGWLAVSYSMLAFPLGIYFSKKIFSKNSSKKIIAGFFSSSLYLYSSNREKYVVFVLICLTVLSSFIVLFMYYKVGIVNYISGLTLESQVEILIKRTSISYGAGIQIYKNIFVSTLLPIISYTLYVYKAKFGFYKGWFWWVFLITSLGMIIEYKKAPIIMYYLGFFIINIYLKGGVNFKQLIKYVIYVLLMLVGVFIFITKETNLFQLFNPFEGGLAGRILVTQISSMYAHFEHFPQDHQFIGLHSLSNFLSNLFGLENVERSGRIIMKEYAGAWLEQGYGGVMNTFFLGEAWANFGFSGLLISPIYVGFLIGSLFYILLNKVKTPIIIGLMTYFTHNTSISGGINDYIYNPILVVVFILIVFSIIVYKGTYENDNRFKFK